MVVPSSLTKASSTVPNITTFKNSLLLQYGNITWKTSAGGIETIYYGPEGQAIGAIVSSGEYKGTYLPSSTPTTVTTPSTSTTSTPTTTSTTTKTSSTTGPYGGTRNDDYPLSWSNIQTTYGPAVTAKSGDNIVKYYFGDTLVAYKIYSGPDQGFYQIYGSEIKSLSPIVYQPDGGSSAKAEHYRKFGGTDRATTDLKWVTKYAKSSEASAANPIYYDYMYSGYGNYLLYYDDNKLVGFQKDGKYYHYGGSSYSGTRHSSSSTGKTSGVDDSWTVFDYSGSTPTVTVGGTTTKITSGETPTINLTKTSTGVALTSVTTSAGTIVHEANTAIVAADQAMQAAAKLEPQQLVKDYFIEGDVKMVKTTYPSGEVEIREATPLDPVSGTVVERTSIDEGYSKTWTEEPIYSPKARSAYDRLVESTTEPEATKNFVAEEEILKVEPLKQEVTVFDALIEGAKQGLSTTPIYSTELQKLSYDAAMSWLGETIVSPITTKIADVLGPAVLGKEKYEAVSYTPEERINDQITKSQERIGKYEGMINDLDAKYKSGSISYEYYLEKRQGIVDSMSYEYYNTMLKTAPTEAEAREAYFHLNKELLPEQYNYDASKLTLGGARSWLIEKFDIPEPNLYKKDWLESQYAMAGLGAVGTVLAIKAVPTLQQIAKAPDVLYMIPQTAPFKFAYDIASSKGKIITDVAANFVIDPIGTGVQVGTTAVAYGAPYTAYRGIKWTVGQAKMAIARQAPEYPFKATEITKAEISGTLKFKKQGILGEDFVTNVQTSNLAQRAAVEFTKYEPKAYIYGSKAAEVQVKGGLRVGSKDIDIGIITREGKFTTYLEEFKTFAKEKYGVSETNLLAQVDIHPVSRFRTLNFPYKKVSKGITETPSGAKVQKVSTEFRSKARTLRDPFTEGFRRYEKDLSRYVDMGKQAGLDITESTFFKEGVIGLERIRVAEGGRFVAVYAEGYVPPSTFLTRLGSRVLSRELLKTPKEPISLGLAASPYTYPSISAPISTGVLAYPSVSSSLSRSLLSTPSISSYLAPATTKATYPSISSSTMKYPSAGYDIPQITSLTYPSVPREYTPSTYEITRETRSTYPISSSLDIPSVNVEVPSLDTGYPRSEVPLVTYPSLETPRTTYPSEPSLDIGYPALETPRITYPEPVYPTPITPRITYPEPTYPRETYPDITYPRPEYPEPTYPDITYPPVTGPPINPPEITIPPPIPPPPKKPPKVIKLPDWTSKPIVWKFENKPKKRAIGYKPSVIALHEGIFAKKAPIRTSGFGVRPILGKKTTPLKDMFDIKDVGRLKI